MLNISIVETSGLGDRSYLIDDGRVAVVVDPQRDIDRILERTEGLRITHVLETHIHNDYVTGGYALAEATGAQYIVPAGEDLEFDCRTVDDGDQIDSGRIRIRVLFTPGHTDHHVSYALHEGSGDAVGVFTGGSMLFGSTGRTDLVDDVSTADLSRLQYRSVQRLAHELPVSAAVYPTHGFGSFCSASPTDGDDSTVGDQLRENPALTQSEQEFVDGLLAELADFPAYYAHMGVINKAGPAAPDLSLPAPVDADELRRRIAAGEWVVDLRNRTAFAAGHLAGTYGFELSGSFVSYLGWLYAWDAPLTLIGDDEAQIAEAQRELTRIGVDRLVGQTSANIESLAADDAEIRRYRVAGFDDLADALGADAVAVLDVRQADDFAAGHVRGAINIAVHDLVAQIDRVPADTPVWIHCASGYRASIAASLLDRADRTVVLIDDDFSHAQALGLLSPAT